MQIVPRFKDNGRQQDEKEGGGREDLLSLPIGDVSLGQDIDKHPNQSTKDDYHNGLG